jgi:hypothetical protein
MRDYYRIGNQEHGNNKLAEQILQMMANGRASCTEGAKQFICYSVNLPNGRPMTVGDYLLLPWDRTRFQDELLDEAETRAEMRAQNVDWRTYGPDLLEHEARHSDQWQHFPPYIFIPLYFGGTAFSYLTTMTDGDANPWETGANPYKGQYWDWKTRDRPMKRLWMCIFGGVC